MVLDQFLHYLLVILLRERKPKSVRQADENTMARGRTAPRQPQVDRNRREKGKPMVYPAAFYGQDSRRGGNPVTWRSRTNIRGDQQCYNCRQYGHLITVQIETKGVPAVQDKHGLSDQQMSQPGTRAVGST